MGNLWYVALRLGVRLISGPVFQPVCLSAGWRGGRNGFSFQIRGIWKKIFGGREMMVCVCSAVVRGKNLFPAIKRGPPIGKEKKKRDSRKKITVFNFS